MQDLSYTRVDIRTDGDQRILFKALETTRTADGNRVSQGVEMLIQREDDEWRTNVGVTNVSGLPLEVEITAHGGGEIDVLVLGDGIDGVAAQAAALDGVNAVLATNAAHLAAPLAVNHGPELAAAAAGYSHVLAPSSTYGKDVLPHILDKLLVLYRDDFQQLIETDPSVTSDEDRSRALATAGAWRDVSDEDLRAWFDAPRTSDRLAGILLAIVLGLVVLETALNRWFSHRQERVDARSPDEIGRVVNQAPDAGTPLPPGSDVKIYVGRATDDVPQPPPVEPTRVAVPASGSISSTVLSLQGMA